MFNDKKQKKMAKKKSEEKKGDAIDKTCVNVLEFWELCKLLFADTEETPYKMNELKETNKFYDEAREMAKELEIDWDKMDNSDSNRIMINMLADRYERIGSSCDRKCKIEVSVLLSDGSGKSAIKEVAGNA